MLIVENWKKLWKSYSVLFSLANILQAISMTVLSVLGVINVYFAFKTVMILTVTFGALGLVGRLIAQPSTKKITDDLPEATADEGVINGSNKHVH